MPIQDPPQRFAPTPPLPQSPALYESKRETVSAILCATENWDRVRVFHPLASEQPDPDWLGMYLVHDGLRTRLMSKKKFQRRYRRCRLTDTRSVYASVPFLADAPAVEPMQTTVEDLRITPGAPAVQPGQHSTPQRPPVLRVFRVLCRDRHGGCTVRDVVTSQRSATEARTYALGEAARMVGGPPGGLLQGRACVLGVQQIKPTVQPFELLAWPDQP